MSNELFPTLHKDFYSASALTSILAIHMRDAHLIPLKTICLKRSFFYRKKDIEAFISQNTVLPDPDYSCPIPINPSTNSQLYHPRNNAFYFSAMQSCQLLGIQRYLLNALMEERAIGFLKISFLRVLIPATIFTLIQRSQSCNYLPAYPQTNALQSVN